MTSADPVELLRGEIWLYARPVQPAGEPEAPWTIVTAAEGVEALALERRSCSLAYLTYERRGAKRRRMLTHAGRSLTVGPEIRG